MKTWFVDAESFRLTEQEALIAEERDNYYLTSESNVANGSFGGVLQHLVHAKLFKACPPVSERFEIDGPLVTVFKYVRL